VFKGLMEIQQYLIKTSRRFIRP